MIEKEIGKEINIIKTKNIFPEDHKYITFLKKVFRHEFRKNGFRRISTPFFEEIDFFKNIFGNNLEDNIIEFNISEKGKLGLNPNPSILNLKAYIDGERKEEIQPVYSYFMDKFYPKNIKDPIDGIALFGGDIIGENDVIIDIQNLYIVTNILNKIGLKNSYEIRYNYTGSKKEQEKYKENLFDFYSDKKHLLTQKALELLENDIFKLFSSTDEEEQILAKSAPSIIKYYKKESKKEEKKAKEFLNLLDIEYIRDEKLFGDYDFNDGVIWEIILKESGKRIASGAGYNHLSNLIGEAKEIPSSGFWVDVFKLVEFLKTKDISIKNKDKLDLFFVQLGDDAKKVVLPLSMQAREAGIKTSVSLGTPSMREQMLKAGRSKATYIVLVGLMEARKGIFQVRNLEDGTQKEVKKEDLIDYIIGNIPKENLDFYDPSIDLLQN